MPCSLRTLSDSAFTCGSQAAARAFSRAGQCCAGFAAPILERDLLLIKNGQRVGVEVKYVDAAKLTPSIRTALADLTVDRFSLALGVACAPGARAASSAIVDDNADPIPTRTTRPITSTGA
jgi:hypothetical protein